MDPIQSWSVDLEKLKHPQKAKIRKFLERGCVAPVNKDTFICRPILGYNSTTYTMSRKADGSFKCNCQGYNKRGDCSHIQALYLRFGNDEKQGFLF